MKNLCIHATDKSDFLNKWAQCDIMNEPCGFIRYCVSESCITMTEKYYDNECAIKNKFDKK